MSLEKKKKITQSNLDGSNIIYKWLKSIHILMFNYSCDCPLELILRRKYPEVTSHKGSPFGKLREDH